MQHGCVQALKFVFVGIAHSLFKWEHFGGTQLLIKAIVTQTFSGENVS